MATETLEWATIQTGTIVGIYVAHPDVAAARSWVGPITPDAGIGIGCTTTDGGQTFAAPPIPPPTPQDEAVGTVQNLAAALPSQISQAIADAQTLAGVTPGQPLTAEQVAALQRNSAGWPQLLGGLAALVTATGLVPPTLGG